MKDGEETEERFKRIFDCCDIVLYCSEIGKLDVLLKEIKKDKNLTSIIRFIRSGYSAFFY
jgi:hypothetical protein